MKVFWREFKTALNTKLAECDRLDLTCHDVLFGAARFSKVINFLILLAKQFIAYQHYQDAPILFNAFVPKIISGFAMEKCIARSDTEKEKFRERWNPFITSSNGGDRCNIDDV